MDRDATVATMRTLIRLNLIAGLLLAGELVALGIGQPGLVDLAFLGTMLGVGVLLPVEVVAALVGWRRHRVRAFLPVASLVASVAAAWALAALGIALVLWLQGSPHKPEKFLNAARKQELTQVAADLLGPESARARDQRDGSTRVELTSLPDGIVRRLRANRISDVSVDTERRLVMLSYARRRTWYQYLYMGSGILDRLPPPAITDASIRDWGVLIDIVRRRKSSEDMAHDWTAARAELERTLGSTLLARLTEHESATEITPEEKRLVLSDLNGLIAFDSRLSERVDPASVSTAPHPCGKWVDWLTELLLKEKILRSSGQGRPLTLSANLEPSARRGVEWLHFGLVCSQFGDFGGFVQRTPHFAGDYLLDRALEATSTPLGDGWYFAYD